jgi:hypothetical protein
MLGKFANMKSMATRMGSMMRLSGGKPEDQEAVMKDLLETTSAKIAAGKVGARPGVGWSGGGALLGRAPAALGCGNSVAGCTGTGP